MGRQAASDAPIKAKPVAGRQDRRSTSSSAATETCPVQTTIPRTASTGGNCIIGDQFSNRSLLTERSHAGRTSCADPLILSFHEQAGGARSPLLAPNGSGQQKNFKIDEGWRLGVRI